MENDTGRRVKRLTRKQATELAAIKARHPEPARTIAYVEEMAAAESDSNEVVRQALRDTGLTRGELQRQTGVDIAVLSRFLAGTAGITLATFDRLRPLIGLGITRTKRGRKPSKAAGPKAPRTGTSRGKADPK